MAGDVALALQFILELLSRERMERAPEPDLVMSQPENVEEYRRAGLIDGNGASLYLFTAIQLCSLIRPGDRVLDLACGPANLLMMVAELNPEAEFIGIDLSSEMLACAETLRQSSGARNVRFEQGDITRLQAHGDRSVDAVISTLSLHHLPSRTLLDGCLADIARVTRPDGGVYLLDFTRLKRKKTVEYFSFQRTKGLSKFLAEDYYNSMMAAFHLDDYRQLMARLAGVPGLRIDATYGVPFLMQLSSRARAEPTAHQQAYLRRYWDSMQKEQRKDFEAMRLFFAMGGLSVPHPARWAPRAALA
jgi:ubiquinone/menaquinone biosynthesis C-methylase UbiE